MSFTQALDIWMGACTAFVFSALIEFTIVNYIWRRDTRNRYGHRNWWVVVRCVNLAQTMIVFRQYSDDETLAKRHLTDRVDVNR